MITMSEHKCILLKLIGFAVFLAIFIGFFPNNDASAYEFEWNENHSNDNVCLLYTSDAADECVNV